MNRRANEIAEVLNGMLGTQTGSKQLKLEGSATTPALTPVSMQSVSGETPAPSSLPAMASEALPERSADNRQEINPNGTQLREAVQIKADTATNSLVVIAKPEDYRLVEAAIRRLDVLPTQVLIEATIVEVSLNDKLKHGVRWFFQYGNHGVSLDDGSTAKSNDLPGFNYTFKVGSGRVVLNALESITDIEVISSPALTVLDNQTANLKVGDQVPVATRSARSVVNPDTPVVNDIEMKDTGIILSVTPRVNSSGLVMLDISQEASDVVQNETSAIDSPTIRQRKINSSVAAQSGTEIVLGGLISTRRTKGKAGVPILKDIPLLGTAFTNDAVNDQGRTELLIIIRPTVIGSRLDVHNITQEIKARMQGVSGAPYGRL
ncbi:type II secretion system protein GspD [Microvirga arabica]|uniref:type II secretion system protein GspD n=1 Tax=Microvirga arabica TaxID=1128671 RepID=UPI0024837540